MKKKMIIGNWKMNPTSLDEAKRIYRSIRSASSKLSKTETIICPPSIYIKSLMHKGKSPNFSIGAQNVFSEDQGAHTGEISAVMLKDLGVNYVIVGHSERREQGETDEIISRKTGALLELGIHPVLCVGEKVRDENGEYLNFLKNQIKASLDKVPKKNISKLIIAYEPIWAIGAKESMEPFIVQEMVLFTKKTLSDIYGHDSAMSTPILYGGSVNFRNAGDIIIHGQADGLLVGRESVNISGFRELLKTVDSL